MGDILDVRGRRALIIGAAHEVGFNAALTLATHGCRLVLAGDEAHLREKSDQLVAQVSHADIKIVELDLRSCTKESVVLAVEVAWHSFGGLDLLLCCSSHTGPLTSFLDTSMEHLEEAVNVNFKSACMVSMAVGKWMQQTGGSIIFITSIIGTERGLFPGVAIAGASVAAINYLTRAMAMELGKYKIRVNAIARGLHNSDSVLRSVSEDVRKREGERVVPLKRWIDVGKDLSAMILYLAGDSSSYITGTVVFVDGGQSLTRPRMRSYL